MASTHGTHSAYSNGCKDWPPIPQRRCTAAHPPTGTGVVVAALAWRRTPRKRGSEAVDELDMFAYGAGLVSLGFIVLGLLLRQVMR